MTEARTDAADDLDASVLRMIEAHDVAGLLSLAYPGPCACRGPQGGAPFCPCETARRSGEQDRRWRAVAKRVVPYWLNKGRIVVRGEPEESA